jgi:hypothetical protein
MKLKSKVYHTHNFYNWFAWYPVKVYPVKQQPEQTLIGEYLFWVWLEKIERKKRYDSKGRSWWFKRLKNK